MKTQNAAKDVPAGCRCIMYGKDNRHWPCPIHGKYIISKNATPLLAWIWRHHEGSVIDAATALRSDKSTLYRNMKTAYVINDKLYTIKRKSL